MNLRKLPQENVLREQQSVLLSVPTPQKRSLSNIFHGPEEETHAAFSMFRTRNYGHQSDASGLKYIQERTVA
jgi:hypothetical protein